MLYRINLETVKKEDVEELEDLSWSLLIKLKDENGIIDVVFNENYEIVMYKMKGKRNWEVHPKFENDIEKFTTQVDGLKEKNEKKKIKQLENELSLDDILDKISEKGIESLSKLEKSILKKHSKQ